MESYNRKYDDRWNVTDTVVDVLYWQDVSLFTASLARKLGTSCPQGHSFCIESRT